MVEPNRLQGESRPNVVQDAPTPGPGVIEAARAPAGQQHQPSPGRAMLGLATQLIGVLLVLAWLFSLSPPVAIGWLALALVVCFLRRTRTASPTDASLPQGLYESLSVHGDQTATELGRVFRDVLIVLGWAAGATAVVISLATIGANLSHEAQSLVGLAMLLSFLGMLVIGPIWTIRRLHRSAPDGPSPSPDAATNPAGSASARPGRGRRRIILAGVVIVAILFVGYVGLSFLGARVLEQLRGTVEFGSGGSGCSVEGRASTFAAGGAVYAVAHLTREVPAGTVVTFRVSQNGSEVGSVPRTFDVAGDCVTGTLPGASLMPAHYRVEYLAGAETLATGEFDIAASGTASPSPPPTLEPSAGFKHEWVELEWLLPATVAGRPLIRWSVRGADYYGMSESLTADELLSIQTHLVSLGLTLDDVGAAIGGRSDVALDPPYFVNAYRFGSLPASELPRGLGIDHPEAGAWKEARVGGKAVLVGSEAMFDQGEHVRGRPYVYNSGSTRFLVATDHEAWAADALRQLP